MEADKKRLLQSGSAYRAFFPKARGQDHRLKNSADVADTIRLIKQVVRETLDQTARIAPVLQGKSVRETCRNIWHFVYRHIQYKKDKPGVEQVREPARTWADRWQGVDCDCYTTFISSILTNLHIPHLYRITKYHYKAYYQHIYPIVPLPDGDYLTLDCVTDEFDYEADFTDHKDYKAMYLDRLDGLGDIEDIAYENVDVADVLAAENELGFLKKIFKGPPGGTKVGNLLRKTVKPLLATGASLIPGVGPLASAGITAIQDAKAKAEQAKAERQAQQQAMAAQVAAQQAGDQQAQLLLEAQARAASAEAAAQAAQANAFSRVAQSPVALSPVASYPAVASYNRSADTFAPADAVSNGEGSEPKGFLSKTSEYVKKNPLVAVLAVAAIGGAIYMVTRKKQPAKGLQGIGKRKPRKRAKVTKVTY
jgi:hypothetical protein